jgi:peptidoglycan/LPS O-acetylase OafA/YrhL
VRVRDAVTTQDEARRDRAGLGELEWGPPRGRLVADASLQSNNVSPEYRADIDGLRAVAVVLVVAFHAFPTVVTGGFVGVDVFFVISGYLITGLILSDLRASKFSFARFYARRARRILPALAVVLAAVLVLGWRRLLPAPYQSLGLHAFASTLFFPNLMSWSEVGYFDVAADKKPLLHLWSLGVEEQFYLVWPAVLLILSWRWRWLTVGLSVIVAGSFIYSFYATGHQPAAAFYSPLSRLWELGVGGILASTNWQVKNRSFLSVLGVILIVGSAIALQKTSPFPGALALFPVAGAALVIISGSPLLGHKWPVSIGLISYPLYLWHWPLLSFAAMAGPTSWLVRAAIVAASFILAVLTAVLIERPVRFGRLRPLSVSGSLAAMTAIAGFAALIWGSGGLLWRYSSEILPVLATMKFDPAADNIFHCWLPEPAAFEILPVDCGVGDTLVWGDSYAGRLYLGLKRDGVDMAQFIREGCPPSIGAGNEACMQSNAAALRRIGELKPKKVILFAVWLHYQDKGLYDGLAATLAELKKNGGDVIIIGQPPYWSPGDLPTQVYNFWNANGRLPDRLPLEPKPFRDIDGTLARLSTTARVKFVSAFDALCNDEGCLTHTPTSRAELLTWDNGHLTPAGARFLAKLLQLN